MVPVEKGYRKIQVNRPIKQKDNGNKEQRNAVCVCVFVAYLIEGSAQISMQAATAETEVSDQTFHFTQSQYDDTGPTSPSADPITPGAWQGNHWSANFKPLV